MTSHPLDLAGKVAVVTGGNRGIGLGIVRGLASAGCNVAIWGRDSRRNNEAVAHCHGLKGAVAAMSCDVTQPDSIEKALASTCHCFGDVDGIFANAGIGGGGRTPFLNQSEDEWEHLIRVNLLGTRNTLAAVLRKMTERSKAGRGGGRVIVTSSIAANLGTAYNQHYAATKSGLIAIVRAVSVEFARYGITANALLPGYTETEMVDDLIENERFMKAIQQRLPIRRLGAPSDYAGIAIYLMSDLSAYHTGDVIAVDGGFSIS